MKNRRANVPQKLKADAKRAGTPDLLLGTMERRLAAEENTLTASEHAKKGGLIGARGTVRDLSTNPKRFDAFGGS